MGVVRRGLVRTRAANDGDQENECASCREIDDVCSHWLYCCDGWRYYGHGAIFSRSLQQPKPVPTAVRQRVVIANSAYPGGFSNAVPAGHHRHQHLGAAALPCDCARPGAQVRDWGGPDRLHLVRHPHGLGEEGMARLDATLPDVAPAPRLAPTYGGRCRKPAWGARDLSRILPLSYSWFK